MCHPECIIYLGKLGIRKAHGCWICEYAQKIDLVQMGDIKIHQKGNVDKSSAGKVRVVKNIDPPSKEPHRRGPESIFDNEYHVFLSHSRSLNLSVSQNDTVCKPDKHAPSCDICDSSDDHDTQFVNADEGQQKVVSNIRASLDGSMSQGDLKSMLLQTFVMKRYKISWPSMQARITIVWGESVKNRMRNVGICPS